MKGYEQFTEADIRKINAQRGGRTVQSSTDELAAPKSKSKYRNQATYVGSERFDSKREADYWLILKARLELGEIEGLSRQFELVLKSPTAVTDQFAAVASYFADFRYRDVKTQRWHYVDAKGVKTKMFILKAKWLMLQDGIEIECV